jgi:hypothetical protein
MTGSGWAIRSIIFVAHTRTPEVDLFVPGRVGPTAATCGQVHVLTSRMGQVQSVRVARTKHPGPPLCLCVQTLTEAERDRRR